MKRYRISKNEMKLMNEIVENKTSALNSFNQQLKHVVAHHDKEQFLDETKFLPTGPKAYQLAVTEEHKKWLKAWQDKNRFIGKDYFGPAPEYSEDSEMEEQNELTADEAKDIVETYVDENGVVRAKIRDDYDPNNAESVDDGEMTKEERNIFDFAAIKDTVAAHLEWKVDDVFDSVLDALNELHADEENYEAPEGLREVVEQLHTSENIKLLTMKSKDE